jgi:hypothetical protein
MVFSPLSVETINTIMKIIYSSKTSQRTFRLEYEGIEYDATVYMDLDNGKWIKWAVNLDSELVEEDLEEKIIAELRRKDRRRTQNPR